MTAGTTFFDGAVPDRDAPVWQRMRDSGAVLVGKLHMSEWAIGGDRPEHPLRTVSQPLGSRAHHRRVVGRLGRGDRRRHGDRDARNRHRRIGAGARGAVRAERDAAVGRARVESRLDPGGVDV